MNNEDTLVAFANLTDLASDRLGGAVLGCSDDFFASVDNLIRHQAATFDPDAYYERGKVMDGWESRRRRSPGHDWAILRLGAEGRVYGVDIDTSWFMGNHPPFASVEACRAPADSSFEALRDEVDWTEILRQVPLQRGSHNLFAIPGEQGPWTHIRLRMFPDGGIARLRVYGTPSSTPTGSTDLAALAHGGRPVACSDMFFSPMENLIAPGRPEDMSGGWETRRRRDDGHDWIVVEIVPGRIREVILDTAHFKGNFPDQAWLEGLWWRGAPDADVLQSDSWERFLGPVSLQADHPHHFPTGEAGPFTHVRLNIAPCGGVARMRLHGEPARPNPEDDPLLSHLAGLSNESRFAALMRCCGSTRWARAMAVRAPFASRAELFGWAAAEWWRLDVADWSEAFSHHPRIGADVAALREKFADTADWSAGEQAGVSSANDETLERLAAGNRAYEARYGYLFIVCASGKSAAEMLEILESRLDNPPAKELRIAAGEQAKITRLRLEKLAQQETE